jgi:hypothetical protein
MALLNLHIVLFSKTTNIDISLTSYWHFIDVSLIWIHMKSRNQILKHIENIDHIDHIDHFAYINKRIRVFVDTWFKLLHEDVNEFTLRHLLIFSSSHLLIFSFSHFLMLHGNRNYLWEYQVLDESALKTFVQSIFQSLPRSNGEDYGRIW